MTNAAKLKLGLFATLAFSLLGLAWLVFQWLFPPFSPPVLPVPNGYDDLLRAAELLAPRTGFYSEMKEDELKAIVEQNEPALKLASEGLQKECMALVDWSPDETDLDSHLKQLSTMRELARAFAASARHARINGQVDEAVVCGLDLLELAPATGRGGLVIDRIVAQAICGVAFQVLRNQVDQLSREDCERLQKNLELSPLQLDDPNDSIQRDMAYTRHSHGIFVSMMMVGVVRDQIQETLAAMEGSEKRIQASNTMLQTHLALRAFQLDNNRFPEKLDALVPNYLPAVPQDLFALGPLSYRHQADGYLLYSVGPDGVDDNGVETQDNVKGDLLLEAND